MFTKFFIVTALLVLISAPSMAQVASADVNIVSVDATRAKGGFVCTVAVNNHHDDDSRETRVVVLLPLETPSISSMTVTGGRGKCTQGPAQGGFVAWAVCDLGQLPQGPSVLRTITINTAPSAAAPAYPHTCSAFVFSAVGDINKANNYMFSAPVP